MMVPSGGFQAGGVLDSSVLDANGSGWAQRMKLSAAAAAADDGGAITSCTDLPTLFNFPESVHPAYGPIGLPMRLGLAVLSATLAAVSTYTKAARRIVSGSGSGGVIDHIDWRRTVGLFAKFALRAVLIGTMTTTAIQETFLRPSRIDTPTLAGRGWLPSSLSRFDSVQTKIPSLDNSNTDLGLGVHYLRYDPAVNGSLKCQKRFDVLHCNHGFGASSLSWLPALPSLADRIGARVGLAHDAVGFGLTERPKASRGRKEDLIPYSLAGSAAIGVNLVTNELLSKSGEQMEEEGKEQKSVALFAHSMGCATTLRMALDLPRDARKFIVLVAPALMLPSMAPSNSTTDKKRIIFHPRGIGKKRESRARSFVDGLLAAARQIFVDAPFGYFLRRVVGKSNFWMTSLQSVVWGNADGVSDADGLRFQWPAINKGWEKGLLAFIRSRLWNVDAYPGGDATLLSDVLEMPDTEVVVIAGGSDKVVPATASKGVAERFSLRYVPLPGRGHDPFEENPEEFVSLIEALLEEQTSYRQKNMQ